MLGDAESGPPQTLQPVLNSCEVSFKPLLCKGSSKLDVMRLALLMMVNILLLSDQADYLEAACSLLGLFEGVSDSELDIALLRGSDFDADLLQDFKQQSSSAAEHSY